MLDVVLYAFEILEGMRRVLLCMLEAAEGELCLLEVLEAMRCVRLCMREIVEFSKFWGGDAPCVLYAGGSGG